jgi:hypothetical protein
LNLIPNLWFINTFLRVWRFIGKALQCFIWKSMRILAYLSM